MGWFSPLSNYGNQRLDEQRRAFNSVRGEISSLLELIDSIVDSFQPDDRTARQLAVRSLERRLEELAFSPWESLRRVTRRPDRRTITKTRGDLESLLQSLRDLARSEQREDRNRWQAPATQLLSIRSVLDRIQSECEVSLDRRFRSVRKVGSIGSGLIAAVFLILELQLGIQLSTVTPLAPITESRLQSDGTWKLTANSQSRYFDEVTRYLAEGSPDIAILTPVTIAGDDSAQADGGISNTHQAADYEQVWRIEFTNGCYSRSQFVSTLQLDVSLDEATEFPWAEIGSRLPEPVVAPVDLWSAKFGDKHIVGIISNTGTVPAIVTWSLVVGETRIAEAASQFLASGEKLNLRATADWAVIHLDEQGRITDDLGWSKSPGEWKNGSWTMPEDTVGLLGTSPVDLESKGITVLDAGSTYQLLIAVENLNGITEEKVWSDNIEKAVIVAANVGHFFNRQPVTTFNPQLGGLSGPGFGGVDGSAGDVIDTVASQVFGTRTPVGDGVITASLNAGILELEAGRKRSAVTVVDRYLSARGRLVCYVRFRPSCSGMYSVRLRANDSVASDFRVKIDRPQTTITRPATFDAFRTLQRKLLASSRVGSSGQD